MAGGFAACGFAAKPHSCSLQTDPASPETAVFGDVFRFWREKTAFSAHQPADVYFGLTVVRFFSETASLEYGV
jgi:hypothetical protein